MKYTTLWILSRLPWAGAIDVDVLIAAASYSAILPCDNVASLVDIHSGGRGLLWHIDWLFARFAKRRREKMIVLFLDLVVFQVRLDFVFDSLQLFNVGHLWLLLRLGCCIVHDYCVTCRPSLRFDYQLFAAVFSACLATKDALLD